MALPVPVRALNAVGRRAGARGRLDAAEMLRAAQRRTGLSDLGPDTGDALAVLVASLEREARLTTLGRFIFGRMLRTFLVQRLQVVEALRQRPALAAAPVERPLFVIGYWRTGTTLLHNLLAQADDARPLLAHEVVDPLPPALRGVARDTRPLRQALQIRGLYYLAPEVVKIHDFGSGPAECLRLLGRSFTTSLYPHMVPVPSYEEWLWGLDADAFVAVYALHRMQLQTLQADGRGGYWVLKSPAHLANLDALLTVYPDAAVVQTHRDPVKVVGSLSSLATHGIGVLAEPPDPQVVGRQVLERTVRTLERAERARALVGKDRIIDVGYAELVTDPVGVTRRIHQRFGYPHSDQGEARMRRWLADNPQGKHGVHRYTLEQYGLDAATVDRLTAPYRARYDIPSEA
jgi:hypothetical protein